MTRRLCVDLLYLFFSFEIGYCWTIVGDADAQCPNGAINGNGTLQGSPCAGIILSKTGHNVSDVGNSLAILVGQDVSPAATWVWLDRLLAHIDPEEIVCLSSQLSTVYGDEGLEAEPVAKLRTLTTSVVTEEMKKQTLVPSLEVPQFVVGIPAALLTHVRRLVMDGWFDGWSVC